jgi:NAD(P)-dependent dehydrogenase (short-subunit alcohol dehydrogenase family)
MTAPARIAAVIGGGNGIGGATGRLMRERGWPIAVADADVAGAERVARDLDGFAVAVDVGDEASVEKAATVIEGVFGPVHALIAAAAVFQDVKSPAELPMAVWERTMQVNLTGTYLANRAFGARMAGRGAGSIVTIASIAAIASMPVHACGTS